MSVIEIIIIALDPAERIIVREAVKHFADSVDLKDESDETIKAFKSTISDILEKIK